MQKAAGITLQLLGKFRVCSDSDPPTSIAISARKSCALLAYVALHAERSVSRSQLATLLWADRPDRLARNSLRQCLISLRADLAPFAPDLLHLEGDTVELRLPPLAVDATALAALASSTALAELVRAAGLYRGAFLADFELGVETFDEWLRAERDRLEAVAARVYEACAEGFDRQGQSAQALESAERLVALDPLREDWQRLALRLGARYRGREAALARADAFTALLKRELDVAPSSPTLALIDDIRRSTPAPPVVVCGPLATDLQDGAAADLAPPPVVAPVVVGASRRRPPLLAALSIAAVLVLALSGGWFAVRDHALPVQLAAGLPSARPAQAVPAPVHGYVSVLVLPFASSAKGGEDQAVADRLTGNLIDELSHALAIRVISAQTSSLYRGKTVDVAAVGAELGVRYVVEGQVHVQNDRLQITVALIDSYSRLQVWSDRSEHAWADRFSAQDEVPRGLARALDVQAVGAESRRTAHELGEPGVEGLLARGWDAIYRNTMAYRSTAASTTGEAKDYFEEALRRDPDSLTALIGLAAANVVSIAGLSAAEREASLARAEDLLRRVIARNQESVGAFYWLGLVQRTRGQLDEALRSFARATKLSPSFAVAYAQAGYVEGLTGRADEGLAHIRYAIRLNPQDPTVGLSYMFAGQIELERGHFGAAIDWLSRAVELVPHNARANASLAAACALAGDMTGAARWVAEVKKLVPGGPDRIAAMSVDPYMNGSKVDAARFAEGWRKALGSS
jgi:DNA-binding SARP family transcriptional activator/TolB-like protein/Flp pilus assembly protein TadD